jgi:transcriptional regulator with XRE-family HTH domain
VRPTQEWLVQPGGLAETLRALRRAAGLTGDQLAAQLGWTRAKVPKIENGRQMPSEADVTAWAQACGQPDAANDLLAMLAEAEAAHRQFRHQARRGGYAAVQMDLDKLVRRAERIVNVELTFIPGLLQTPDYARYRLREAMRASGDDGSRLEEAVAARMRRQEVLYESGREFEFIILESVLRIGGAPDEVMLGQLDRLLGVTGLANVTLRVIPLGPVLRRVPANSFLMIDDLAYVETYSAEDILQGREWAAYDLVTGELRAESVTGDQARALITAAAAAKRR